MMMIMVLLMMRMMVIIDDETKATKSLPSWIIFLMMVMLETFSKSTNYQFLFAGGQSMA